MSEPIRYSISDELKRLMSGENETVFRMVENRFCVDIQSRFSGLTLVARDEESGGGDRGKPAILSLAPDGRDRRPLRALPECRFVIEQPA